MKIKLLLAKAFVWTFVSLAALISLFGLFLIAKEASWEDFFILISSLCFTSLSVYCFVRIQLFIDDNSKKN